MRKTELHFNLIFHITDSCKDILFVVLESSENNIPKIIGCIEVDKKTEASNQAVVYNDSNRLYLFIINLTISTHK